ncbi:MAG TPA: methyltransferase, partial [Saprospiraceae bacterium]|nr:methyltransferase [Saprospiraceae bacterium]
MDEDKLQTFIQKVVGHFEHGDLISLNLSNPKIKSASIKNIQLRPIRLDGKNVAQLKAEQGNKVLTSHLQPAAMAAFIDLALRQDFIAGHCVTAGEQGNILVSRKGHVNVKWKAQEKVHGVSLSHDRQKEYLISAETPFLYSLGVTSSNGLVVAGMQRKFKQINRFTEIFSGLLDEFPTDRHLEVMDMGCGKGYLTFAMYDRLSHMGYNDISVTGVDL